MRNSILVLSLLFLGCTKDKDDDDIVCQDFCGDSDTDADADADSDTDADHSGGSGGTGFMTDTSPIKLGPDTASTGGTGSWVIATGDTGP